MFRTKDGEDAASILFPKVFAMSGNTESVSKSGNITTIVEAICPISCSIGGAQGPKPKLKLAKFRFTAGCVSGPKKEAAVAPRSK